MLSRIVIAFALVLLLTAPGHAALIFTATLSGDQEVPPVVSPASGSAILTLNDAQDRLEIDIFTTGLDLDGNQTPDPNDDLVAAHIHRAPFGANGPVVFGFVSPNNDLNGDLVIDPVAGTISSAWDAAEGNGTTLTTELANLLAEGLYFNLHTPEFPAGEIRGQILLPAPATISMILVGVAGLGVARRYKRGRR